MWGGGGGGRKIRVGGLEWVGCDTVNKAFFSSRLWFKHGWCYLMVWYWFGKVHTFVEKGYTHEGMHLLVIFGLFWCYVHLNRMRGKEMYQWFISIFFSNSVSISHLFYPRSFKYVLLSESISTFDLKNFR